MTNCVICQASNASFACTRCLRQCQTGPRRVPCRSWSDENRLSGIPARPDTVEAR